MSTARVVAPLSTAELNRNEKWFKWFNDEHKGMPPAALALLKKVTEDVCQKNHIILETMEEKPIGDFKKSSDKLASIWENNGELYGILDDAEIEDQVRTALKDWAKEYEKIYSSTAASQSMHADNPGIHNSIVQKKALSQTLWCQDTDIEKCLEGVILKDTGKISGPGLYRLSPVTLKGAGSETALQDRIETITQGKKYHLEVLAKDEPLPSNPPDNFIILKQNGARVDAYTGGKKITLDLDLEAINVLDFPKKGKTSVTWASNRELCNEIAVKCGHKLKIDGEINLHIPANDGGSHWRLAMITIRDSQLVSANLWDPMPRLNKETDVFKVMQQNITQASPNPSKPVQVTPEPSNTQPQGNYWSCADLVMQHSAVLTGPNADPFLEKLRTASSSDTDMLRKLIVEQILAKNPHLKLTTGGGDGDDADKSNDFRGLVDKYMHDMRNHFMGLAEEQPKGSLDSWDKVATFLDIEIKKFVLEQVSKNINSETVQGEMQKEVINTVLEDLSQTSTQKAEVSVLPSPHHQ